MKRLYAVIAASLIALPAFAQSDAGLDAKVRGALGKQVGMKMMMINVDVDKGVVTLKGNVDSEENKRKAGEVARKVDGVKGVHNELKVEKKG